MALPPWNRHFFSSTRGRIVLLLRRASSTVDELAQALHLTDNAVRAHLATLERDGLVYQSGMRRGGGKPALVYDLASGAEQLFPKAYDLVLKQLLEILSSSISPEQVTAIMQGVGQRLAAQWDSSSGDVHARLQRAVAILNELGGLATLEESQEVYAIQGYSCPLAAVVPGHPEVCQLTEAFLTDLTGIPIEEHCGRDETAKCCFTMPKNAAKG